MMKANEIKKKTLILIFTIVSAFFTILGFEGLIYTAKAAPSVSSADDFKAISYIRLVDLDNYETENSVSMVYKSYFNPEKYSLSDIKAVVIESTKEITEENISSGVPLILYRGDSDGENFFYVEIPKTHFLTSYRCVFYINSNSKIICANYDDVKIDYSVYDAAKIMVESSAISYYEREVCKKIIQDVEADKAQQEEESRKQYLDSTIQDMKDYGQALLGDYDFQKIIALIGGLLSIVIVFSFLSIIFGLRR